MGVHVSLYHNNVTYTLTVRLHRYLRYKTPNMQNIKHSARDDPMATVVYGVELFTVDCVALIVDVDMDVVGEA